MVLLVVEEPCVRDVLAANVHAQGWLSVAARTSQEAWRLASQVRPDVVVMDVDSPATADCAGLLSLARANAEGKPIISVVISALDSSACHGEGTQACADLWVAKPLDANELTGRLVHLLRQRHRPPARAQAKLRVGAMELDREQPTLRMRHADSWLTVDLARTEHRLLECMLADPTRVHSRESLRDAVWPDAIVELRTVDQYVRRLRRTLGAVHATELIGTVVGAGYRLRPEVLDRLPG